MTHVVGFPLFAMCNAATWSLRSCTKLSALAFTADLRLRSGLLRNRRENAGRSTSHPSGIALGDMGGGFSSMGIRLGSRRMPAAGERPRPYCVLLGPFSCETQNFPKQCRFQRPPRRVIDSLTSGLTCQEVDLVAKSLTVAG